MANSRSPYWYYDAEEEERESLFEPIPERIALKQIEILQVTNIRSIFVHNRVPYLIFYRPLRAGVPPLQQLAIYTRQQLKDEFNLHRAYDFDRVIRVQDVFRQEEQFEWPDAMTITNIVDNSYYCFTVLLKSIEPINEQEQEQDDDQKSSSSGSSIRSDSSEHTNYEASKP